MSHTPFRVQLDIYHGPPDLLLYLVRRHEVDVMDLPMATITAQFLEFLDVLKLLHIDTVTHFVATAAALLEIKSRMALPQPDEEQSAEQPLEDDPRSDLVARLVEYKKFKDAAAALEEQAAAWLERFPRLADDRPGHGKDPAADRMKEVELWDLVSALGRVLKRKTVESHTRIQYDDVPISTYIERIGSDVQKHGRTAFSTFFEGTNERLKIVSIFLAILELLRHHGFRAEQPAPFGEIWILPPLPRRSGSVSNGDRDAPRATDRQAARVGDPR